MISFEKYIIGPVQSNYLLWSSLTVELVIGRVQLVDLLQVRFGSLLVGLVTTIACRSHTIVSSPVARFS